MLFGQVLVATALAAVPVAAKARSLKPRVTCNEGVYILRGRGTGETPTGNRLETLSASITAEIPGSFAEEIEYPASLDLVNSIAVGVTFLRQRLTDYAAQCPGHDVVLMGYSQGAVVTGVSLAGTDLANTQTPPIDLEVGKSVAAIINFGDPLQVPGQGTNALGDKGCTAIPPLARKGQYKDNMDVYADRLLEFCNPGDGICCGTGSGTVDHVTYWAPDRNTTGIVVEFVKEQVAKRDGGAGSGGASTSPASRSTVSPSSRPTASASGHASATASASSSGVASPSPTRSASVSPSATSAPSPQSTGAASGLQMSGFTMLAVGFWVMLANL